jgi:hypothetical protein
VRSAREIGPFDFPAFEEMLGEIRIQMLEAKQFFDSYERRLKGGDAMPAKGRVTLGRHRRNCSVCSHPKCAEMEADFVSWRSPEVIAQEFGLADRASVYRHAHALGLFPKRQRNVRVALERIIEKAGEVEVTGSAVVAAVQAYSKINETGRWVERSEHVNLNELFEQMTLHKDGGLRPKRHIAYLVQRYGRHDSQ